MHGGTRLAPVAPRKVVAIGLNYLDHIRESGMEVPTSRSCSPSSPRA